MFIVFSSIKKSKRYVPVPLGCLADVIVLLFYGSSYLISWSEDGVVKKYDDVFLEKTTTCFYSILTVTDAI